MMSRILLISASSWLLFSSMLGLAACKKQAVTPITVQPAPADTATHPLSYLALGDSYTIGQSVNADERFPYLTAAALRSQGMNVGTPQYIATTGWTTANLQDAISQQDPSPYFDIVSLLIGVNDQYQHRDTADYRIRFTQLLNKAIALAAGRSTHVFVLSIPDYSATPFAAPADKARISTEIGWFNAINKEISLQYHIAYIDITPLTLDAATDDTLLAADHLHYSAKEHQKWASLLATAIKNAL